MTTVPSSFLPLGPKGQRALAPGGVWRQVCCLELLGSNLIFSNFAQFFVLPLLSFLTHCSCIPLSGPCTLGFWQPGKTGGMGPGQQSGEHYLLGHKCPAVSGLLLLSFSNLLLTFSSSSSSSRCCLSPGAWVSALTSADQLLRGLSITCQNLYSFDICRYVPLFPTFHQQKGLSNSFQIRRPGGDTQHLWTFPLCGAGGGPGPGTALR